MIWVLGALTFFHIAFAIAWWGTSAVLVSVVAPAALRLTADQQVAWWRSVGDQVKVFLPVAAGLTILLGIARGIAGGVLSILGTPYGYTWIAALILGVGMGVWGARVTGVHSERLAESTVDNVVANVASMQRVGRIEQAGFGVLLLLMIAMRFGY